MYCMLMHIHTMHARIQDFLSGGGGGGGGGVQDQLTEKYSDRYFLVLHLAYRGGPLVYFKENYNFPMYQGWGVQHFPGWSSC